MPKQQPPSRDLFARAAELRVAGATWKTVAKEVNRSERTVYYWPRKYPDHWEEALARAERVLTAQSDCESVLTLRRLLASGDEKIRWHAAKALIARRVERDKIDLRTPQASRPPLSCEAARFIAFLDGRPDAELTAITAELSPAPPAIGGGEPRP